MRKQLVSFDLDMTLLDHRDNLIPDSSMEALRRLRERGIVIVLATGRDMDNYYSRKYRDLINADGVIHTNGTKITVGERVIFEHHMDPELLKRVLAYADGRGYSVGVTVGDDDYYTHKELVEKFDIRRWGMCGRQFRDPFELLRMNVRTLAYIGEPEGAKAIEREFPELKLPLFAGLLGADVVERTASKAVGLRRLCQYLGVRMEDTYAFGDSMNDVEIIQEAGTGIAMGNALPKLKEAADYVTADIRDDGVYQACVHFGLI